MLATEENLQIVSDCRDAARINAVVNDPAVRPYVGAPDAGFLDLSPLLADRNNIFPFGLHGGFALLWTAPHTYEVHTFILPSGRGFWAKLAARCGIELAAAKGARMLWTRVPSLHGRNIRAFSVSMGMRATGETAPLLGEPYDVYAMDVSCL